MEENQKLSEDNARRRAGKRRMDSMTPKQRKEFAVRAARARWSGSSELSTATHTGMISLLGDEIALRCAVLEDGTRVLTQTDFLKAIGRHARPTGAARGIEGVGKVAPFLEPENLQSYISPELRESSIPIAIRMPQGHKAWGYKADILPQVCTVYLRARDENVLLPTQIKIAQACDILIRGLAHVGIIALIDEATGYQKDRARDALSRILEAFVAMELQPWIKTFPGSYYENLFRLRGLDYPAQSVKKPQYFGTLTNDIVYSRLAPGVLEELKKAIPRDGAGRPRAKYFQMLTVNHGYRKLLEHLGAVVAIMKISRNYAQFYAFLDEHYPKHSGQLVLPYNPSEDSGEGI